MADQDNNANEQSGGGSKMLLIALAVTNLLSLGGLAYFVVIGGGDEANATPTEMSEPEPAQPEEDLGPTVALGTFNITLADPGQNRYLKAVLKARMSNSDVLEEIDGRNPELRDRVIDYLSSLTVKETQGVRSKSTIRQNLKKRINNILRTGEVESVFLTEFVTQ